MPGDQKVGNTPPLEPVSPSLDTSPLTPSAFARLQETINGLVTDLVDESFRIVKRHKSEVISAAYVDAAATYLLATRARRLFRHSGTVGGILVGGSLSNILSMVQTGQPLPVLGAVISISLAVVGTFLLALHMAKD